MCAHIDCYLEAFSKLSSKTVKPKALLLLAVLDLIAAKKINREFIEITPELAAAFAQNWQRYMGGAPFLDLAEVFYEMAGESFWELAPRSGVSLPAERIRSLEKLTECYLGARIDKELFRLCLMEPLRRRLQTDLLEACFERDI